MSIPDRILAEPPGLALLHLLIEGNDAATLPRRLRAELAQATGERQARLTLLADTAEQASLEPVAAMLARHDAPDGEPIERIRRLFDWAVTASPEASVALYSLGQPARLAVATEELVELLDRWGLLDRRSRVLDLGCGIGRVAGALAPRVGEVIGLDVSPGMIRVARERWHGLSNAAFEVTDGRGLPDLVPSSFHLVLAVDSFPYLVEAAVAERHVADAARLLRPGGSLVVFNCSYRGDPERDRADLSAWGTTAGLVLTRAGTRDLAHWDGLAFCLEKPAFWAR